jgi:uncharacterized membrane protein YfcA
MFHDVLPSFATVAVIFLGAGLVKGVIGMGLPTIAMGVLGLVMPLPQAAALLMVPAFVTNVWQTAGEGWREVFRRLWLLQAAIAAGVALAAVALPNENETAGRVLLGACLLAYGLSGLAGWRLRAPPAHWHAPAATIAGVCTGVLAALTGVYVLPAVPYLQSLGLERRRLAQGLGLTFTTSTLALGLMLASHGALDARSSMQSTLALLPALAGMVLGQRIRDRMSERTFRACFFAGLAALGAWSLAVGH